LSEPYLIVAASGTLQVAPLGIPLALTHLEEGVMEESNRLTVTITVSGQIKYQVPPPSPRQALWLLILALAIILQVVDNRIDLLMWLLG
jgi:hypothetical protein